MELEVEEDALSARGQGVDNDGPSGGKELAPDLVEVARITQPVHQRHRPRLIRNVERDDGDRAHAGHSNEPVSEETDVTPRTSHHEARSRNSRPGNLGSRMAAVPIPNAVAPATRYWRASVADVIPPTPMMGAFVARYTFEVASRPIGSNAPPLTPPLPNPRAGFRLSRSTSNPGIVFTSVNPFAPASRAT